LFLEFVDGVQDFGFGVVVELLGLVDGFEQIGLFLVKVV